MIVDLRAYCGGRTGFAVAREDGSIPDWQELGAGNLAGDTAEYIEEEGRRDFVGWKFTTREAAQGAICEALDLLDLEIVSHTEA
jgi:hypothetical protein